MSDNIFDRLTFKSFTRAFLAQPGTVVFSCWDAGDDPDETAESLVDGPHDVLFLSVVEKSISQQAEVNLQSAPGRIRPVREVEPSEEFNDQDNEFGHLDRQYDGQVWAYVKGLEDPWYRLGRYLFWSKEKALQMAAARIDAGKKRAADLDATIREQRATMPGR